MSNFIINKGEVWTIGDKNVMVMGISGDCIEVTYEIHDGVDQGISQPRSFTVAEWAALNPKILHDLAVDSYTDSINWSRYSKAMAYRADKPKVIDPKTMTRYAVLQTLSKNVWVESADIGDFLRQMKYNRSPSSIRSALRKIVTFGFAVVLPSKPTKANPHGKHSWKLTERGFQYMSSPDFGKPVKKLPTPRQPRNSKKSSVSQTSAPSGAPGGSTMCIDLSKPELNAAIANVVSSLIADKKKFSAHDVTKELRKRVAEAPLPGIIDTNETGTVYVDGKPVARIDHDYVRDAVHELYHQGKMAGYDRVHSGSFWEYEEQQATAVLPNQAQQDPDTASSPVAPATQNGGSYDGTPTL